MSENWTLSVKNFGKIRKADIEVAPFTFFLGDNNSGKSFLMNLLTWIDENSCTLSLKQNPNATDPLTNTIQGWMGQHPRTDYGESICFDITEKEHRLFLDAINIVFNHNHDWASNLFETDRFSIEALKIDFPFPKNCRLEITYTNSGFHDGLEFHFSFQNNRRSSGDVSCPSQSPLDTICAYEVAVCYFRNFCCPDNSLFIPSPRTGYVLTLKTFLEETDAMRFQVGNKYFNEKSSLIYSHRRFLDLLTWFSTNGVPPEEKIVKITDFLEKEILDGQIVLSDIPAWKISYKPNGYDKTLPLHVCSGAVTELVPLVCLLKYGGINWFLDNTIYFEEPEMGLHPQLQWKIARVLIKLVNAGVRVCVSTHSDLIVQHVNNMIKLTNRPGDGEELRQRFGYDPDDVISSDKIRMYQFDVNPSDHKTDVQKLECTENGFKLPTFGRTLREMQEEYWETQIESEVFV